MIEQQYIDLFNEHRDVTNRLSDSVLNSRRDNAFEEFCKVGFPTTDDEEYKHSNIADLFDRKLGINLNNISEPIDQDVEFKSSIHDITNNYRYILNDNYYEYQDHLQVLPDGVFVGSMSDFAEQHTDIFSKYYGKIADIEGNGMVAYNTMFVQKGIVVYVPENKIVEEPIQVINLLRGKNDVNINRRRLIIIGDGSHVKLLFCDHTIGESNFVVTQVTEAFLGKQAQLDYCDLEENSEKVSRISSFFADQDSDSTAIINSITLNNGYSRNNFRFALNGEHAEARVAGLAICDNVQHVDNFAFVEHASPNCTSNQLFKHVLRGKSTGIFCGRILVDKDAQKTMAYQNNRNLIGSKEAQMYSKPQLEIYADDVKCSHGLTTGELDEDALFYMQVRGIPRKEAEMLLMIAFTKDVINFIRIGTLKDSLDMLIDKRFRGTLVRCGDLKDNKEALLP